MRVYRKLHPTELAVFAEHMLRLCPDDRRSRFTGSASDHAVMAYCRRMDWFRGLILGCFVDGALRGAAELKWDDTVFARRAELAVTVEGPWQNQGIGTELLQRVIVLARNRAIETIFMICLLDNRRIQSIARKFEASLSVIADMAEADIALPFPTHISLFQEALADGAAIVAQCLSQLSVGGELRGAGTPGATGQV